jgi:hypothetical protein
MTAPAGVQRRLNCRWSFKAASAVCSRRTPDAALPSSGGGRPIARYGSIDDLYVVRSYLNDWQDGRPSTRRTVEGLGGQNRLPWPTIGVIDTRGREGPRISKQRSAWVPAQNDRINGTALPPARLDRSCMDDTPAGAAV